MNVNGPLAPKSSEYMPFSYRSRTWLAVLAVAALAGCASDERLREPPPPRPAEVRAQIANLLPAGTPDRAGWATDIYAAFAAMGIAPSAPNICAVLAVTEQESTFRADPPVPELARIAREEIDRRAERLGVPKLLVHAALRWSHPTAAARSERIAAVRTEHELSGSSRTSSARCRWDSACSPMPIRCVPAAPMQVSIAFAERHAREHGYPYSGEGSIRREVFSRRGGLYFGIAHLLDYRQPTRRHLYRYADFNAGWYASRNAAFQAAVTAASGVPLALDGDLVHRQDALGTTEAAVRSLAAQLDIRTTAIRRALEQGDRFEFEHSDVYTGVFALAERARASRCRAPSSPTSTWTAPRSRAS